MLVLGEPILLSSVGLHSPALSLWPCVTLPCKECVLELPSPTSVPKLCPKKMLSPELAPYLLSAGLCAAI